MIDTTTGVWKIESGKLPTIPEKINEEAPCEAFPFLIMFYGSDSSAGKGKCGMYLVCISLGSITETTELLGEICSLQFIDNRAPQNQYFLFCTTQRKVFNMFPGNDARNVSIEGHTLIDKV